MQQTSAMSALTLIGRGFWMLLECRSPQNTVKNPNFFLAFLKIHNELGKVTKFGTSRPLFHGEIAIGKKVQADSAPPSLIGLMRPLGKQN